MKIYTKAILPQSFQASGISCGIKKAGQLDLALFYSSAPAIAACRFTTNKIPAAPIMLCKKYLRLARKFQALIVNSGNANAFTGRPGVMDAQSIGDNVAAILGFEKENVLVASTGIIGRRLPVSSIKKAVPLLVDELSERGIHQAKRAIMTTDKFPKEITAKVDIAGREVLICGVAKGAGMIAPNLATMLCFIFTDANITKAALEQALGLTVQGSFNCISVDGCMSTNDSVMLLANGQARNRLISGGSNLAKFTRALQCVCLELAKLIVRDAEGATKFIRINVSQAKSFLQAKSAALAIANSNLFKTAMFGENPNYGRIIAALGASRADINEDRIDVKVSPLYRSDIFVEVSLGAGNARATVYTSDLTPEYIKINAEYN